MEYLIGSLLTLFVMLVLSRKAVAESKKNIPLDVRYSQSYTYDLLRPVLPYLIPDLKDKKPTQSSKHIKSTQVRIIFTSNEAYWIAGNKLYVAELLNGSVSEESVKEVDTMDMDKVQLDKLVFIVEQLTEGLTNDNSSSGN